MNEPFDIIETASLTEKATLLSEKQNKYVFRVRPRANKIQIKQAIEKLFQKKVVDVNTCNYAGKKKRERRADFGRKSHWKKAIVTLKEGREDRSWSDVQLWRLKIFRPLTPTLRFKSLPAFDEVTKTRPAKSLLEPKKKTGGRNHFGRLTSRHIGGGHKQHYRKVDFKRRKRGVEAEVLGIEYDPNRSARIALIKYSDGELSYILAPDGLRVGARVMAGRGGGARFG